MKKWIPVVVFLFCFLLLFLSRKENIVVLEEVVPIREEEKIVGLIYDVSISKSRFSSLQISTSILQSIMHYKNIQEMDSFFVEMHLKYPSSYQIQEIRLKEDIRGIKSLSYTKDQNKILFHFSKKFFQNLKKENDIEIILSL